MRSAAAGLMLLAFSCGDANTEPPREVHEIVLESAPDARAADVLGLRPTLHAALTSLKSAAEEASCRGVFLRVGPMGGSWGRMHDLADAIAEVREAGKLVHCHFGAADNVAYTLLARSCDRIAMSPAGDLSVIGLAVETLYIAELLESYNIEASILHVGRYKGAGDVFTEREMPPEARESLGALLDDLDASFREGLAARELDPSIVDQGPFTSLRAEEAGLVDAVEYARASRRHLEGATDAKARRTFPEEREDVSLADLLLGGDDEDATAAAHIVVANLQGPIQSGRAADAIAATTTVEGLDELAEDESVAAVVLRVESPGGSVLASDQIWGAVRRLAEEKLVVASLGDVAASGGFYIASAADHVFATPSSIVGSIGVVGGKLSFGAFGERFGVRSSRILRGARAGMYSPLQPFSEDEARAFFEGMESAYYRFLRRIATGRDLTQAQVAAGAEGRVMSGRAALELGLIDELGSLPAALAHARANVPEGETLPVREWPRAQGAAAAALAFLNGAGAEVAVHPQLDAHLWVADLLARERMLAIAPFTLDVR